MRFAHPLFEVARLRDGMGGAGDVVNRLERTTGQQVSNQRRDAHRRKGADRQQQCEQVERALNALQGGCHLRDADHASTERNGRG